jgi:hypothetical protein
MGIQVGKTSVIYDDDPRLSNVWKGDIGEDVSERSSTVGGGGGGGGGGGPELPKRPQLSDIIFKGFDTYDDSNGMQKVKAKFRVYNSSTEEIDGFSFALTKPDAQGGRS